MKLFELLKKSPIIESMDLMPVSSKNHPKFGTVWSSVFPDNDYYVSNSEDPHGLNDTNEEPKKNPDYNPDYEFNLSNHNMEAMFDELGFLKDGDTYHIPIDQFISICTQWLKQHIDRRTDKEEPTVSSASDQPTMITGGRPEGYFNEKIIQAVKIARMGKEKGATHMSAA